MKAPEIPAGEPWRLAALRGLGILDTAPEEAFDHITALAAHIMNTPMAAFSLIDEQRQWFKSRQGLDVCETPRDVSFCGHAIVEGELLVVNDARQDERFHDNPLVTGEPHVVFYAGVPVVGTTGELLGTLCVLDSQSHQPSAEQLEMLQSLAILLEDQLLLRESARYLQADLFPLSLLEIDQNGAVVSANVAAGVLFGRPAEDLCRHDIAQLLPDDDVSAARRWSSILTAAETVPLPFGDSRQARSADGSAVTVEMGVQHCDRATAAYTVTLLDVSRRDDMVREYERAVAGLRLVGMADEEAAPSD